MNFCHMCIALISACERASATFIAPMSSTLALNMITTVTFECRSSALRTARNWLVQFLAEICRIMPCLAWDAEAKLARLTVTMNRILSNEVLLLRMIRAASNDWWTSSYWLFDDAFHPGPRHCFDLEFVLQHTEKLSKRDNWPRFARFFIRRVFANGNWRNWLDVIF